MIGKLLGTALKVATVPVILAEELIQLPLESEERCHPISEPLLDLSDSIEEL